jgi:hypothetical protein
MVLAMLFVITTGAALMAEEAIQHDSLVHSDEVHHFAYRALEAGINTFLSDANKNPNELTCNSSSPAGGQCTPGNFRSWKPVQGTSGTGVVPEYYAWGTPRFCFTESCPTPTTKTTKRVLYVKEPIYGAAGWTTVHMSYEQSTLNLVPVNGFLTHVWWSTYEATDPKLKGTQTTPPKCTYDWRTGYEGPDPPGTTVCSPIVFASGTQVYGPIYTNDSVYITGSPTLGPVETADPRCLFVEGGKCIAKLTQAQLPAVSRTVHQTTVTFQASASGEPLSPLPKSDATLERWAAVDGCVYTGPTTIRFDAADEMTVWSKATPRRTASATTPLCPSTHTSSGAAATNTAAVPNAGHGDGVIFVKTAPSPCTAGANPFDDYKSGKNGTEAQYATTTNGTYYFDYWGAQAYPYTNCEGDAFVSDNPAGGGIEGQLTIGTSNDVIATGTVKYLNCGTGFASTVSHPCNFNITGTVPNDSLGLIAENYVVVNHPLKTVCTRKSGTTVCKVPKATSTSTLATTCTTAVLGTPTAALCNPVPDSTSSTLTIDAAVLSLNHSFAVDNESLGTGGGVGGLDGTLKIYGSIDQKWRGAVGIVGTSGYVKDYDWNSEGGVIAPPHYLAPSTPSWAISSSAIAVGLGAPTFGAPPTR